MRAISDQLIPCSSDGTSSDREAVRRIHAEAFRRVLAAADALEFPLVALVGSIEYYRRYGFVPATQLGIEPPDPAWGDHFQVRTLTAYRPAIVGGFRYAPAFEKF